MRVPLQEMMSCPVEASVDSSSSYLYQQQQQSTPKLHVTAAELMSDLVFSPAKQKKGLDQRLPQSEPCHYNFQPSLPTSVAKQPKPLPPSTPSHVYIKKEPLSESSYAYPQPPPAAVASSYQQLNSGLLLGGRRKATRQDDILAQVFAQSDELDELLNSPQTHQPSSTPCLMRSTNTGVHYYLTDELLFSQQESSRVRDFCEFYSQNIDIKVSKIYLIGGPKTWKDTKK
jgi:hypothetical protein